MPKRLINDKSQTMQSTPVVNLLLQGKGGVGKSLIASLLAQFYKDRGVHAICVDTDPVCRTFSQYNALGAQPFQVTDEISDRLAALRFPHRDHPRQRRFVHCG